MSTRQTPRSGRSGQNKGPRDHNSRTNTKSNFRPKRSNQGRSRQPKKVYIQPSKFIQPARPSHEVVYTPENKFSDFNIDERIKQNLAKMGFDSPSPIQDKTIPLGLMGTNIVGIANTGTGKTAAFAVPVLHKLITEPQSKAIILAPTRELAEQIEQQCVKIGRGSKLDGALLIGGASITRQLKELKFKPRIIIGTPGRIKDHLGRGSLNISDCNLVVLDEVDRMLDMGFVHDITDILDHASTDRQSFYFSATLDSRVKGIIERFSKDTVHVSVKSGDTNRNIEQNIVKLSADDSKIDKLHDILIHKDTTKAIIFDDTQRNVEKLSKELSARGFQADSIHGRKSQPQRQRVLNRFKKNQINVLVATDVAARGIDVSDISHVINYSTPQCYDDYVHRIGRTGRAGKVGHALTFIDK